jgi:hypothetical protein
LPFARDSKLSHRRLASSRTASATPSRKMSLQYLGISHFPVLHRQFSSPTSRVLSDSSPSQDLTQDSKDVLIERLNDLILHLSTANVLEDSAVTAVHSQVDNIEVLLRGEEKHQKPGHSRSGSGVSKVQEDDPFWGPATPTQNIKMRLPDMAAENRRPPLHRNLQMSPAKAIELAHAAEDLASKLCVTVEELQRRKEESDVRPLKLNI